MDESITGCGPKPTMHEDFGIGTRVHAYPLGFDENERLAGTITGVAFAHIFYSYIVTLDAPLPKRGWGTIAVSGCLLKPISL